MPVESGLRDVTGCGEQSNRDGQVQRSAVFSDIRGCKIDCDPSRWQLEPGVAKRRCHPVAPLPNRPLREAHDRERGQTRREVDLDTDHERFDPAHRGGSYVSQHGSIVEQGAAHADGRMGPESRQTGREG
jgi:hypothetical protein